jgi:hypothetical protein
MPCFWGTFGHLLLGCCGYAILREPDLNWWPPAPHAGDCEIPRDSRFQLQNQAIRTPGPASMQGVGF